MLKIFKHIEARSLIDFPKYTPLEETGSTFQENALQKAEHAAKALGKWVLADDSGLVVPALKGSPGVVSRRFAGEHASDAENRKKLLNEMASLKDDHRQAYFECCLALSGPADLKKSVTGTCEGFIIEQERGNNGFGYDSLFVKHDYDKTFAELDDHTKNRISHRRKAFEKLSITLERLKE